jgi:hypothetical protein
LNEFEVIKNKTSWGGKRGIKTPSAQLLALLEIYKLRQTSLVHFGHWTIYNNCLILIEPVGRPSGSGGASELLHLLGGRGGRRQGRVAG